MWADDPNVEEVPDDEQVRDYHRLLDIMAYVAREGGPEGVGDVNYLGSGLWEFRCAALRLVFYDTDGRGGYTEKPRIRDMADSKYPDLDTWWFPEMDVTLRLANYWPKVSQKADPLDIQEALQIREEDIAHDRDD